MNIFKKRINIKYFPDILKKEDAQEMVKKIPHNFPDYFKCIPRNMFNPVSKTFNRYDFTIKSCPGFTPPKAHRKREDRREYSSQCRS